MHNRWLMPTLGAIFFLALLSLLMVGRAEGSTWLETAVPGGTVLPVTPTLHLPVIYQAEPALPSQPVRSYGAVPIHPNLPHCPHGAPPDVDLEIRSWVPYPAYLGLVGYGGETDPDAPQIAGMFAPPRVPAMTAVSQVYDWNWSCNPPAGCRGGPITAPYDVTLLSVAATRGEPLHIPSRGADILDGVFRATVLYADETGITLAYTRDDSPACGYVVHLEEVAINPGLVDLYRRLDSAGREKLPALRNDEVLGVATGADVAIAVRDRGMFMDPRSCKDWWRDFKARCTVQLARPAPRPSVDEAAGRATFGP
jgi:hypothetical protein